MSSSFPPSLDEPIMNAAALSQYCNTISLLVALLSSHALTAACNCEKAPTHITYVSNVPLIIPNRVASDIADIPSAVPISS